MISDAESEAAETQVWLEFSCRCGYISKSTFADLDERDDHILSQVVKMTTNAKGWVISTPE
jgi:four helix bundle protein